MSVGDVDLLKVLNFFREGQVVLFSFYGESITVVLYYNTTTTRRYTSTDEDEI